MNKCILLIWFTISSVSFGQLHSVGFHAGAMGTTLGNNFWNGEAIPKIDFLGGLNYQYRFTSHLTLGTNIEYAQFGAQVPIQFYDVLGNFIAENNSSWDFNYVSVPLIVGYEIGGKISFKPKAAIIPSILQRAVYNFKSYEGTTLAPYKQSYYRDVPKFDIAGMLGIDFSARFHAGVFFLSIEARYSATVLNNDNFFNSTIYDPIRNGAVMSCLGIRFNLGNPEGEGPTDIIDDPLE